MPLKLRNISQLSGVSSVMFHRALQENSMTWSHCGGGTAQLCPPEDTWPALAQEALLTVLSSSFFWISFNMVCGQRRKAACGQDSIGSGAQQTGRRCLSQPGSTQLYRLFGSGLKVVKDTLSTCHSASLLGAAPPQG